MRFIEYMTGAALVAALAYGGCAAGKDDVGAGDPPRGTDSGDPGSEVAVPADDSGDPTADDTGAVEDTAPKTLDYPAAPYGKTVGATIPNLKYKGYRDGVGDWTDIAMLDYYDPDGSRGIKAIKIEMAAVW